MNGFSNSWKRPAGYPKLKKPRLFMRRTMRIRGKNVGLCNSCQCDVNWRSVSNRCWRCEMDSIKTRAPVYLEKEILMSISGMME